MSELPFLPSKTPFWQDATSAVVLSHRWVMLQLYLDAVLEYVLTMEVDNDSLMWRDLKKFLDLP